ncbi:MAG TPA: DUF4340 domain-containing protein [Candidatus Acidoferrales bacterium]|nr:DUF4340 domain-containing protein [Candidatus Acidoferrales bacterium]
MTSHSGRREAVVSAVFVLAAAVLVAAASLTSPERRAASVFSDEGQPFYPEFHDPQAVKAIEVVDYDEPTATARPLKVEFRKSRWVIASNNDYPIDIGDRLVKTSAALIDLKKDQVRSNITQDHGKYGVIDPLDQKNGSLQGRGKRVTLRDAQKNVLADFILGKPVESKPGWRYVRVPSQNRTYAVKTDADPSARFADWVNSGLLRIPTANIRRVTIATYAINPTTGALDQGDQIVLTQENGQWKSPAGAVKEEAAKALGGALDTLKIVDARPKPADMARDLRAGQMQLSMQTALSLRQFGFLLTQTGRILATDGEMTVEMANGVAYQIRFGDIASSGDRYLFVTTSWDTARATRYNDTSGGGEKASRDLNARFADWFYAIANADFQKLRLTRSQVFK